ncbi:N-acetylmuramoyl-L-alanine amidase [Lysinibacillus sp. M3]|uniref:N-acetylmuramoyl-L-alanine amidase n=1 Tax=Lysinibacillus zambalensis TaxID=3160866 RepID=A0ABV1MRP7_9BACI
MNVSEIEIHPGHWKLLNSGANGILNEVTEARKVAKRVYEILKTSNVPCTYYEDNSSTNQRQNINYLVSQHNKDRDGLIVSIHFNSGGDSSKAIGTEVLYYDQQTLASRISKAISGATGGELLNRGAKQRLDLGVLASTYEPAILIEVCFVNSIMDAAIYRRDFEKICMAIAKELAAYLGKAVPSTPSIVEDKQTEKDDDTMKFSNETTEVAVRDHIKQSVDKKLIDKSWLDKFDNGTMTTGDYEGLKLIIAQRSK